MFNVYFDLLKQSTCWKTALSFAYFATRFECLLPIIVVICSKHLNRFFYAPEIEDRGAYCFCPVCHSVILSFCNSVILSSSLKL